MPSARKLPPIEGAPRLPKPSGPAIFAGSRQPPDELQKIAAQVARQPIEYPLGQPQSTRGTRHAGPGWPHGVLGPSAKDNALPVSPFKPIAAPTAVATAAAAAVMGESGDARRKRRQEAAVDDAFAAPRVVPRYGCWRAFLLVLCCLDIAGSIAGWMQYRYCLEPARSEIPAASTGSWAPVVEASVQQDRGRRLEQSGSWGMEQSSSWDFSYSSSQSGSWSALDIEEEPLWLKTTVQIQGAISESALLIEFRQAIVSLLGDGLIVERVVYVQTLEASLFISGSENLSRDASDGTQFRSGVAAAIGGDTTLADVTLIAAEGRRAMQASSSNSVLLHDPGVPHRRQMQEESTEVHFTVRSDRDLSLVVADTNFIGTLVESINEAATGGFSGMRQLNASLVDFGEQPSYVTVIQCIVRADSTAGASKINALKTLIETETFTNQLAAQLEQSYPGLVVAVRYAGQSCAGNPCGIGGACTEPSGEASESEAGIQSYVCSCRRGYNFVRDRRTCVALGVGPRIEWRSHLSDDSALCWATPPYMKLGDVTGAGVWSELWNSSVERLRIYSATAPTDLAKTTQGQDLWSLSMMRLLVILLLRLLLDRLTRSPTPQPAQFKFIVSNDHLSNEIQEILRLRRSKQKAHPFKSAGGQGGWRMVGGTLAPSRRFQTGAVGEDVHYITAATIPELQHQFHKRLQLPSKSVWPESRLRLALLIEPDNSARLKHPLDENDSAVTRMDPEEDDMAARQEPSDAPASPPSHGDWAGWSQQELTTLVGLRPAPAVHRLALNVGLPYDTELAVPRHAATLRVWTSAACFVCMLCCLSVLVAATKLILLDRGDLDIQRSSETSRALRILSLVSCFCAVIELTAFLGWLVWLWNHGVVPSSPEFPRPARRCCCGKRKAVSVLPEPTVKPSGLTSSRPPSVTTLPPQKGWRGLWGAVAMYDRIAKYQRRLRWLSCILLVDAALSTLLFISLGYCGDGQEYTDSDSQSGSVSLAPLAAGTTGLLCWVVPPRLVPPLTVSAVLEDWRAEGWGVGASSVAYYDTATAQGDLVLLVIARGLLFIVLLASRSGLQVPDIDPKPRSKVVRLLCGCIFNGLLKGCGCGDGSRDESSIVNREILKRKQQDSQGIPRWRKRRWCGLLCWSGVILCLQLVKLLLILSWGGCGPDDQHRAYSFMWARCEAADGAGGLAFGSSTDSRGLVRPFDLRGAPNALLLSYFVCTIGLLEVIGLLGLGCWLDKRPKRVVPEQDALRRTLLELINDNDDNMGFNTDSATMNDDSAAARRVARWLLALEVSGVLEDGGPALFDWMESILPSDVSVMPVRQVLNEARARIRRRHDKQSERDRMADAKLSVEKRGAALLKGETDPGDAGGGHIGLGSGDGYDIHQANHGWRWLERTWSKYLSYHVSADRYSAPWSPAEHTVLGQLAGDRSLTWKQKAARLQELVQGAPRRSPASVKRRWAQLERLANEAGWRCAESGTYRVAGWANDTTGEWMWEYPLDTAG